MKRLIGAGIVAAALACAASLATGPAAATPQAKLQSSAAPDTTEVSAPRHHRRHARHVAYRPVHQPYYYGRPIYYRPYPYQTPAPFIFGIGFGPSWW